VSVVRRPLRVTHKGKRQRLERTAQCTGLKLISDIRLLTSGIDGFYDFYDLNGLNDFPIDLTGVVFLAKLMTNFQDNQ
jgi:hypothetical protein